MKNSFFISVLLIISLTVTAQESNERSRKEIKAEKEAQKRVEIKNLLDNKTFVFNATNATPMGGGSIQLGYYFDVEINGDTVKSYLPFYGVAYNVDYGSRNSPFDFVKPVENYSFKPDKNGYLIEFEIKNGNDRLHFIFHISELGYASLSVSSTNRQAISFYGTIEGIEGLKY